MTKDRNTRIAQALSCLFRTYHRANGNADPSDLARERAAEAEVYYRALAIYQIDDIEQGILDLIQSNVPDFNPAFPPNALQVSRATRRAMERRLEAARLDKLALPPPRDDFQRDPPDVRIKVQTMLAKIVKSLETANPVNHTRKGEMATQTNQRFAPSFDPEHMAKRLGFGRGDKNDRVNEVNVGVDHKGAA